MKDETGEARATDEVGRRDALADAPLDECLHLRARACADAARIAIRRGRIRQVEHCHTSEAASSAHCRCVAEVELGARQAARACADERTHRDAACAVR